MYRDASGVGRRRSSRPSGHPRSWASWSQTSSSLESFWMTHENWSPEDERRTCVDVGGRSTDLGSAYLSCEETCSPSLGTRHATATGRTQ